MAQDLISNLKRALQKEEAYQIPFKMIMKTQVPPLKQFAKKDKTAKKDLKNPLEPSND